MKSIRKLFALLALGLCGALNVQTAQAALLPIPAAPAFIQPYLGIAATRGAAFTAIIGTGTATWVSGRIMRFARTAMPNGPLMAETNCYVNTSNTEVCPAGKASKKGVEYPIGSSRVQCNGGATVAVSTITLIPCPEAGRIPDGAAYFEYFTDVNTTNGPIYRGTSSNGFINNVDGFQYGTGTPTDYTVTGTPPNSFNLSQGGGSIATLAYTTKACWVIDGDSKAIGISDYQNDGTGDQGYGRFFGPSTGYTNLAIGGTTIAGYLAGSHAMRDIIHTYCPLAIHEGGVNDLGSGKTPAQTAAERTSFAALYPSVRVYGTTMTPYSSSTDNFVTTANQTASTNVATFNVLERAGTPGERGTIDMDDIVDPLRTGQWIVGRNIAATTTTAASVTASVATTGIMTVTAVASGTIQTEGNVFVTGIPTGTVVASRISGTGLTGTYQLSTYPGSAITSQTIATGGSITWEGLHESATAYQIERDRLQGIIATIGRLASNDNHPSDHQFAANENPVYDPRRVIVLKERVA